MGGGGVKRRGAAPAGGPPGAAAAPAGAGGAGGVWPFAATDPNATLNVSAPVMARNHLDFIFVLSLVRSSERLSYMIGYALAGQFNMQHIGAWMALRRRG